MTQSISWFRIGLYVTKCIKSIISRTQQEEWLCEVFGIIHYILNQEARIESGALLPVLFSATGANGTQVGGYEHVQLCVFSNYTG